MSLGPVIDVNTWSAAAVLWVAVANLCLNLGTCIVVVCRISVMSADTTRTAVRGLYAFMAVAALASALGPWWWREVVGPGHLLQSAVVLVGLIVWRGNWLGGLLPPGARKSSSSNH